MMDETMTDETITDETMTDDKILRAAPAERAAIQSG
jgi:hypothetical protein